MKDPAFLFYSQDFYLGTATLSFEDRGKFITILCLMHQQGRMKEETISFIVGNISLSLKSKFLIDNEGFWYNQRLEIEIEKRKKFTQSRRDNGSLGGRGNKKEKASVEPNAKPIALHMDSHMEDVNKNEDIIKDVILIKEKKQKIKIIKTETIEEVFLSDEQIIELKELYKNDYEKALKKLSNYKLRSGTKYKSDYHAMIGWVKDSFEKENPLPKTDHSKEEKKSYKDYTEAELDRRCEYSHPQRGIKEDNFANYLHYNSFGNDLTFIRFIDAE